MLDQERLAGTEIDDSAANWFNWRFDLTGENKRIGPLHQPANMMGHDDSTIAVFVHPYGQSVRVGTHDLHEAYGRWLRNIIAAGMPTAGMETGQIAAPESYVLQGYGYPGLLPDADRCPSFPSENPYYWGRTVPRVRPNTWWGPPPTVTTMQPQISEQLESAHNKIRTLQNTVDSLSSKVQNLQDLLSESHQMLLSLSQSYYWTPEWQDKEDRADEDAKHGRSQRYDSVEDLIAELNQ